MGKILKYMLSLMIYYSACMHSTYHICVTMHTRAGTGVLLGHSGFSLEKFDCRKVSGQQLTAS